MAIPEGEFEARLEKLDVLRAQHINPYPTTVKRSHTIAAVMEKFEEFQKAKKKLTIVGRIRSKRGHGNLLFVHIEDETDRIQLFVSKKDVKQGQFKQFMDLFDVGDFIEATGIPYVTKKGERSIMPHSVKLLTKTLRPLPEKWHGLENVETRFRQRYLDLIANPEVKDRAIKRSQIVKAIRSFLDKRGYVEVETPMLQPIPGGANAKPFVTHHNALDTDFYLRIAPELYLKRLLVGGFERVYEIARCFRNEGIDYSHNPEFTQVEFYEAYANYKDYMKLTEKLLQHIVKEVHNTTEVQFGEHTLDFGGSFDVITFRDSIIKYADFDIEDFPDVESLVKHAKKLGVDVDVSMGRGKVIDEVYKKFARPKMIQPTFLIDHPVELSPLSKRKEDDPRYVERFQVVVAGDIELCNAFTELNDPVDQKARFEAQQELLEGGEEEGMRYDPDFVRALEHGMPPAAGLGMGIDRLTSLLTDAHSIKEVILFPTLKPKK